MDIRPILSTLRRHKTAATLIVLEIALSCAIICNAVFLINERLNLIDRPSGLAETELIRVQMMGIGETDNAQAQLAEDLVALRAIPGVQSVSVVNQIPYGSSSWNSSVNLEPDQQNPNLNATTYFGNENLLETLGLRLVAGRDFKPDEYIDMSTLDEGGDVGVPAVILSHATAEQLFPGEAAVGKSIYSWGEKPMQVVGVVERLIRPNEFSNGGPATAYLSMLLPVRIGSGNFLLRTQPERRDEVLAAATAALQKTNPNRILMNADTISELRTQYYATDRSMAWLLVSVIVALLVITALGIVGLASFWVAQRTKQIGVRRALGATRGQILRYFQTENFLLATIGIVLGMLGAYGINQLLMGAYELPRLPAIYLPIGAIALWLLGQIAVFGPARRAAAVPPAVATRSI